MNRISPGPMSSRVVSVLVPGLFYRPPMAFPSLSPCLRSYLVPHFTTSPRITARVTLSPSPRLRLATRTLSPQLRANSMMSQQASESDPIPQNADTVKANSSTDAAPADEVIVQYVVLRRDLIDTWPLGSVVTQGCHASVAAVWSHRDDPHTLEYCSPQHIDSMHKVTLEVKGEAQISNLSQKLKAGRIDHKLWIEQPENIPTCLATKPYPKSAVAMFFKKLKLCK